MTTGSRAPLVRTSSSPSASTTRADTLAGVLPDSQRAVRDAGRRSSTPQARARCSSRLPSNSGANTSGNWRDEFLARQLDQVRRERDLLRAVAAAPLQPVPEHRVPDRLDGGSGGLEARSSSARATTTGELEVGSCSTARARRCSSNQPAPFPAGLSQLRLLLALPGAVQLQKATRYFKLQNAIDAGANGDADPRTTLSVSYPFEPERRHAAARRIRRAMPYYAGTSG